jgi:hypothetical protein
LRHNLIVPQFERLGEATGFVQGLLRVRANMVTTADKRQDAINFGATIRGDDFVRLPKFWAACRLMVRGTPYPAFLVRTFP